MRAIKHLIHILFLELIIFDITLLLSYCFDQVIRKY